MNKKRRGLIFHYTQAPAVYLFKDHTAGYKRSRADATFSSVI